MTVVPDYLEGKVFPAATTDPSTLLLDGHWCGHGEPLYHVFNICLANEEIFSLQLPVSDENVLIPPVVMATAGSGVTFPIYDSRKHPASIYHPDNSISSEAPRLQPPFQCPECGNLKFNLSVGFEVPGDSASSNDTSWFALAVKCVACGWQGVAYEDETA
jgi:hypothetical protein